MEDNKSQTKKEKKIKTIMLEKQNEGSEAARKNRPTASSAAQLPKATKAASWAKPKHREEPYCTRSNAKNMLDDIVETVANNIEEVRRDVWGDTAGLPVSLFFREVRSGDRYELRWGGGWILMDDSAFHYASKKGIQKGVPVIRKGMYDDAEY